MQRIIFVLGFFMSIMACKTPAIDFAQECAARFPPRTDTFRLTTEKVIVDTFLTEPIKVRYEVQTVCPPSDTGLTVKNQGFVDCPPTRDIVKTRIVYDSIVVYQANLATEMHLRKQLITQNEMNMSLLSDIAAHKRQIKRLTWLSIVGWIIVAFFAYSSYKIYIHNR
jgi:hypothetical protein